MLELYDAIEHIPLNEEARKLANDYIARSVFTLNMEDDALHVACASVAHKPSNMPTETLKKFQLKTGLRRIGRRMPAHSLLAFSSLGQPPKTSSRQLGEQ